MIVCAFLYTNRYGIAREEVERYKDSFVCP
jgi:hypothetical protein